MTKDKISKNETNSVTQAVTSKQDLNKSNHWYYTIPGLFVFATIVFSYVAFSLHNRENKTTENILESEIYSEFSIDADNRSSGGYLTIAVKVDDEHFHLDIADNNTTRTHGLSFRERLNGHTGMIFIFDNPGLHGIWMKDMNFAIDILWVNRDGTVVHAETNVGPETYPAVFKSPVPSDYVVELPAGTWQNDSVIAL